MRSGPCFPDSLYARTPPGVCPALTVTVTTEDYVFFVAPHRFVFIEAYLSGRYPA
jgi:hypothetical protein